MNDIIKLEIIIILLQSIELRFWKNKNAGGIMFASTYVGVSASLPWDKAGQEAAEKALSFCEGTKPKFLLVLFTHDADYNQIYQGIRRVTDLKLAGGEVFSLMTGYGPMTSGVAVTACNWEGTLAGPDFFSFVDMNSPFPEYENRILALSEGYQTNFMVFWDVKSPVSSFAARLYDTFGPKSNIIGGGFLKVVVDEKIHCGGCIVIVLLSKNSFIQISGHGWKPARRFLVATRSEKHVVYEIDGERAVDVYTKLIEEITTEMGIPFDTNLNIDWLFSIGFPTVSGEYIISYPENLNYQDGSITFLHEIPENSVIRLLFNKPELLLAHSKKLLDELIAFDGKSPGFNLVVNCIGRMDSLEKNVELEMETFKNSLGANQFIGFGSGGELCMTKGMPVSVQCKVIAIFSAR
jgi:small ligand-binding sensory domain FIST